MNARTVTGWWKGAHGEWFLAAQVILSALVIFGPRSVCGQPAWPLPVGRFWPAAGSVLLVAGAILFCAGWIRQGRGLSALPYPRAGISLIQTGPYALVRHPMYSGLLALGFGWGLSVQSWLTLAYAALLFVFLDLKSRREEKWLIERFPAYRDYQQRVRRLVPFIY
jgi:protein-S-isoprenylcysteine O-methyltransferase Ste14